MLSYVTVNASINLEDFSTRITGRKLEGRRERGMMDLIGMAVQAVQGCSRECGKWEHAMASESTLIGHVQRVMARGQHHLPILK